MSSRKRLVMRGAPLLLIVAVATFGVHRWHYHRIHAVTEDAYVRGNIYSIASRVPGSLMSIVVDENQQVHAGDTIASLDPRDYEAAVARARAALAESTARLAKSEAKIAESEAQLEAMASELELAQLETQRVTALLEQRSVTKQEYDRAVTAERVARTRLEAARKNVAAARAELEVGKQSVDAARASLEAARLRLSYCTISSPVDGMVSRKMADVGEVVSPGQPLCAVVPLGIDDLWVEANYKETQLGHIRVGQRASMRADVDPSHVFTGTVESLSAGTGAAFSLLPAENATGNWVKVVQRVPVKIRFDEQDDPDHLLRLGLTVTVTIDTRNH